MNNTHPANWNETDLMASCKLSFSRASGPGGQNRNKVETSVKIEFIPSGTVAQASERRTQNENRKVALQRLRCKLAVEYVVEYAPNLQAENDRVASVLWRKYCRDGRINISDDNLDWPSLLVELICKLRETGWDLAVTAGFFETTPSQLVKTLKKYSPALGLLNRERKQRGQPPMA